MVWLVWQTPPRQWIYWNLRCDLPRTRHQAPSKWHKGNLEDTGDKAGDKGKENEMIEIHFPFSSVSICLTLENWYEILSRGYQSIQLPVPSFLKKYLRH